MIKSLLAMGGRARTVRRQVWTWGLIALTALAGCSPPDHKSTQAFLDRLSHGPEADFPKLLYGYQQSSPGAQQVLLGMLRVLRPPTPEQHMAVDAVQHSGRFTMVVARVPWHQGPHDYAFQPIIICAEGGQNQVVGYVLPFNDLFSLIGAADRQSIDKLTQWYLQRYGSRVSPK